MHLVGNPKGKQAQITSYYDPEAARRLKALSAATDRPQSAYLREALDDLLKKYAGTLRKASK
jgi:predicted DNA-binding protein